MQNEFAQWRPLLESPLELSGAAFLGCSIAKYPLASVGGTTPSSMSKTVYMLAPPPTSRRHCGRLSELSGSPYLAFGALRLLPSSPRRAGAARHTEAEDREGAAAVAAIFAARAAPHGPERLIEHGTIPPPLRD
ncbi:hypothetical protein NDU88_003131 [Pleurodeles waltl]|uniref:Uncharacterized protein n=1 Tax=Pleurodeles waltl TaxID=8319 RepID=A0AAV7Q853_PLEWA|nr:hypothetical protein NDU88_003131 [Pleurodeles waltl]